MQEYAKNFARWIKKSKPFDEYLQEKKNIDPETAVEWNEQSFDESLPGGNLGS